jgi:hypothetical protein
MKIKNSTKKAVPIDGRNKQAKNAPKNQKHGTSARSMSRNIGFYSQTGV